MIEDRIFTLEQVCLVLSEAVTTLLEGQSVLLSMSPAAGNPRIARIQAALAKIQVELEGLRGILTLQSDRAIDELARRRGTER